ncbi:hypothetical protein BC332_06862 [Capsicum chinense]|nr:hypothetical protein BC332_06862 [Capsicum chinense]
MTCFNNHETPYPCLEIVKSKPNSHAKSLTLKVHPPIISAFSLVRKPLETSLHLTKWSMTETKDSMDNFFGKIVTEKVLLLKYYTHQNVVVASFPSCNGNFRRWRVPPSGFEPYYDGSLLALVQLWDSYVRLGILSKIKIPMRPLDNGTFMTHKGVNKSLGILSLCSDTFKPPISLKGASITSVASSSNKINANQEPHRKRLKKNIKIQAMNILGLVDVSSNIFGDDVFGEDCATRPNASNILKIPHLSLDVAKTQATNKGPSTKLSENVEFF